MNFLAPSVLWGLLAASIPLIIHLISTRRTQKVNFSTLRFIKALEHETIRKLKIRQWLLLFLRSLAIVLLVLVFARPVKVGYFPLWAAGDQSTRMVFLLDNSASMSARSERESLLERSKHTIIQLLDGFEGKPIIDIYQTNPFLKRYSKEFVSLGEIEEVLSSIEETATKDEIWEDMNSILNKSSLEGAFSYPEANKELYIFSDFPQTTPEDWKLALSELDKETSGWRFYLFLQPEIENNMSVVSAEVLSQLLLPNHLVTVTSDVRNQTDELRMDIPIQLYLEDERVGQVVSDFTPWKLRDFVFQAFPMHSGIIHGVVEIPEDDYELDNRKFFQLNIPDRIRCRIAAPSKESISLLRLALNSINRDTLFVEFEEMVSSSFRSLSLERTDVLILINPSSLGSSAIGEIEQFRQRGGGIIAFLGDRYVNADQRELIRSLSFPSPKELNVLGGEAFYNVSYINEGHPLFLDFPVADLIEQMPEVFSHVQFRPGEEREIILSLSDGNPLLMELKRVGAKILIFTVLPDLRWTDLPVRGIFIPLLHRMLVYMTADVRGSYAAEIGSTLEIPLSRETISSEIELIKPSGKKSMLIPDYRRELVLIERIDEAGIYRLFAGGKEIVSFVANITHSENPRLRLSESALLQLFPSERTRLVGPDEDPLATVTEARRGTELWRPFLVVALLVLALETWVGRDRKETTSS